MKRVFTTVTNNLQSNVITVADPQNRISFNTTISNISQNYTYIIFKFTNSE